MKKLLVVLAGLILLVSASSASAAEWATGVGWTGGGTLDGTVDSNSRTDLDNALGAPDGAFLSLNGGTAYFTFGTQFDVEASVLEITWGNRDNWVEYADVYVGTGTPTFDLNNLTFVDSIVNNVTTNILDLTNLKTSGPFDFLVIVDTTALNGGHEGDGFDVDAVCVAAATPIPGAAWLLGSGLIGLVGIRRRFLA